RNFEKSDNAVGFEKVFTDSPFILRHRIEGRRDGVVLSIRAEAKARDMALRSIRCSYVFPLPSGFCLWVPDGNEPVRLDTAPGARYVYGPGSGGSSSIGIPMAALWKPDGPAFTVAVPLEAEPVRVTFEIQPSGLPLGVTPAPGESDRLIITFDMMGIGSDRAMETSLWIYGHEDDWRPALGVFARKYRSCFEPVRRLPAAAKEAFPGRIGSTGSITAAVNALTRRKTSVARIDWNFCRHGEWIPPQAVRFDDFTWTSSRLASRHDSSTGISVRLVRSTLDELVESRITPILYGAFNQCCSKETAESRFSGDIARDEKGRPLEASKDYYFMHAASRSPFGSYMTEQQRRMIDLYPQARGFFLDDWRISGIDFAHDDGLTVVHNRPAYSLGRNRLGVGALMIAMMHESGKFVASASPATIVQARGIDLFYMTEPTAETMGRTSLMSLWRPIAAESLAGGNKAREESLKQLLFWGIMPPAAELGAYNTLDRAYRPLFSQLKGREWVLDPNPLSLPESVKGQVFMVPTRSRSRERDIVVVITRHGERLDDARILSGVTVRVRLPEMENYLNAQWTQASRNPWPVTLKPVYREHEDRKNQSGELVVELPPLGPAGVLRFTRR
ncbi:MAG: hypothetical protein U9N45_07040, partial [Gemmatimonadota bacterium]|nr:hypothetical protein [Gemmatimonadota bacterium]